MNPRTLPLIIYHFILLLAQVFILGACISYIQLRYTNDILPDKLVSETYTQTTCHIVSKNLTRIGQVIYRYRADFTINYIVNNKPYQVTVTGNGLDQAYFHERAPQEETLSQFSVNSSYPCWYDPQHPQIAVLVLRHDWMSTLPLLVPSVVSLIVAFYMLKGIFQFLGLISFGTRQRMKHKRHKH